jgi:hypothetical protein
MAEKLGRRDIKENQAASWVGVNLETVRFQELLFI